ncbi:DUF5107 domain-containing protein [Flagellimonas algicola]|uniref:DUF5107 domain-containing protein n=1 Tax=Flagellimonas algicola TaxID=2583815 RepID=A0ABY2WHH4_9FLAO|nr:DUF5107 domain-containing protein [Allomuricauda algicola]TMU50718.1 DUF5107 domain-containing protein [Allomuricauda algicola]
MKSKVFFFLSFMSFTLSVWTQKATITEKKIPMKTYMFSDPDPIPDIKKNYPYFRFDGFTNKSIQKKWNMVILENDYIQVYINTDVGGKIWGAIEKSTGGEFIYFNDVVKFRDVAQRGPWTSGGLEFNFGLMGHTSTCSTPQDYLTKENGDGSVSCIIGALDLHTNTKWNVEINLQKDKAFFEVRSSWFNTTNLPVTHYHYSNAAAKAGGDLELIYPGDHYVGHSGEVGTWPYENGKDISFYKENNFGTYKSYHVVNSYSNFMGGYWHDDNFGFGNIRDFDKMPGRKIWIWGLSGEGMIWENLLTDTKGQYIEFQNGSTFNQAMEKSSLTPFKHREFTPYDSDLSSELYFPLVNTGGMVMATEHAILNVTQLDNDNIRVKLSALAPLDTSLSIKSFNKNLSRHIKLEPLELYTWDIEVPHNQEFEITLGNSLLQYYSNKKHLITNRPIHPNEDFDWNSAVGMFTKGIESEKQYAGLKNGNRPLQLSQEFYLKSLALDPAFSPTLNRLAYNHYRMMQYDIALEYAKKSLAINTYDPEANYIFGLISSKLEQFSNAMGGFAIASQSTAYRTAAYTEMAKRHIVEENYHKAIELCDKALAFNQGNIIALEIKAISLRLQNKLGPAKEVLSKISDLDNTSTFATHERSLIDDENLIDLNSLITNELKEESFIDLALKYKTYGLRSESVNILRSSPKNAKVLLWLASLDRINQTEWLNATVNASPYFIFPYRAETYEAIQKLMKLTDHWSLKYYASLILWKKERIGEAKKLMRQCGNQPEFVPFYLAKAKLFKDEPKEFGLAIEFAKNIAPNNWRVNLFLIDHYFERKEFAKAAKIAKGSYDQNHELSILGMRYAKALLKSNNARESLEFLKDFEVIPFEGATEGRKIYRQAHLELAIKALKTKDYHSAIDHAKKALIWPLSLGAGKPYDPDERLENSILAYSYEQLGNSKRAKRYNERVINHGFDPKIDKNSLLLLQCLAIQKKNGLKEALSLANKALEEDTDNIVHQWVKARIKGEIQDAVYFANLINSNPKTDEFQMLTNFLESINK